MIEDLQPGMCTRNQTRNCVLTRVETNYESTFIEQPETPAHQFAVKAFKHALFGTPAPDDANDASKKATRKMTLEAVNARTIDLPAPRDSTPPLSPSKQPGGILMTPGTTNKGRKTVSFGSQVLDNEGKRVNTGKSGIPSDCPGKFPSPWTPGTQLKLDASSDQRPRTKLTEALLDARTTTQPKSGQKLKARDDSDITIDLGAPRSESGKYWKEQYESYAERSEKEMKKVVAKQQLAKKFAMKKDSEVTELATKLEQERKQFRQRERVLEQQNKDFQERLRRAMAESASSIIEVAALKARVATLENSSAMPLSTMQHTRASFSIYEDANKEAIRLQIEQEKVHEASFVASLSTASPGKENASPTPRRHRHQSLPDTSTRPGAPTRLGTAEGEASIILGRSPHASALPARSTLLRSQESQREDQPFKSPIVEPNSVARNETIMPSSPFVLNPSSPLPMPSPDPWLLEVEGSSILQMDKMALPVSTGVPYSRPEWNPPPKHQRGSKSISHIEHAQATGTGRQLGGVIAPAPKASGRDLSRKPQYTAPATEPEQKLVASRAINENVIPEVRSAASAKVAANVTQLTNDPKFDMSRITAHHAEGLTQVKRDRAEIPHEDRKEQARRRLEERKRLRKNAAGP